MRTVKNKHTFRKTAIIVASVLVVGCIGVGAFAYTHPTPSNSAKTTKTTGSNGATSTTGTINYNAPTTAQQQAAAQVKEQAASSASTSSTVTTLDVVIISGYPTIKTQIDNSVTDSGTCTLTLTSPGATTITMQDGVQASAQSSYCATFDLSNSNLPSGTWTATINVSVGSQSGTASTTFKV